MPHSCSCHMFAFS
uniref:Uncharacterized protein n=1 Tax=Arundo donax TaxID=35708 RepID=A0A0A8Z444_ARUDO